MKMATKSFKQFWAEDNSFSLALEVFKKHLKEEHQNTIINLSYDRSLDSIKISHLNSDTPPEILNEIVSFGTEHDITILIENFNACGITADLLLGVGFTLNEGANRDFRFDEQCGIFKKQ